MVKDVEVKLEGRPSVFVEVSPEDFSLGQFDAWLRSRFGLKHDAQLAYVNDKGKDFIVDKVFMLTNDVVNVKLVAPPAPPKPPAVDNTFSYTFMLITTLLFFLGIYGEGPVKQFFDIEAHCQALDGLLLRGGVISKAGVSLDAFMAVVCWSSTYLFIRRLWNPETADAAFARFSADSFFGGLAAGGSVVLKALLVRALVEKKLL